MTRRTIGVVDYGAGNLSSVQRALHSLGHRCRISGERSVLDESDLIILPGVGAFPAAMAGLARGGLDVYLQERARQGRPIIGICLGMQLLVDFSTEHRLTSGLGLIPGKVSALEQPRWHIGWNNLEAMSNDPLLRASDGHAFYFNHSHVVESPSEYQIGVARLDRPIIAAIRRGPIVGLQFHPEKSQGAGRQLLSNLVEGLCR
ncbi:MAG TPA: imidazole glycerol phosphate synthase subunit HisH [Novosphingobium sp.]|nr:imidazole glycerol phosphate synthase subunit HisH [Novosphingobium sp.]HMP55175.1 imidazole glycerol phosphate synthase subunit HisH [Novosphingobium sp.]